jgi:MFS transporter, DHA3 family, macrolide efflux protein
MHKNVEQPQPSMTGFLIVWFGQLISLTGSSMASFAFTIWAWQETKQATALAMVAFFSFGSNLVVSPFAGALVDRLNRKLVIAVSDLMAGIPNIIVLLLYFSGNLEIWHLYIAGTLSGAMQAFHQPAIEAAISTMIPKDQYTRASGLRSMAESASTVIAPLAAGFLIAVIGLGGVLIIDIVTFVFAVFTILLATVPAPEKSAEGQTSKSGLWQEALYGFRYIARSPGLLGLQLVFFVRNFTGTFGWMVFAPLILAHTANNTAILGSMEFWLGIGGIVGGLAISAWGGPKRKIHGVLGAMALKDLLGTLVIGLSRNYIFWAIGAFFSAFFHPIFGASGQAIWMNRVPQDVQGRVFAARRVIGMISLPLSLLLVGPATDYIFEPGMQPGGSLAGIFGWLVPAGPGAGMSLMHIIVALFGLTIVSCAYLNPTIRNVEDEHVPADFKHSNMLDYEEEISPVTNH